MHLGGLGYCDLTSSPTAPPSPGHARSSPSSLVPRSHHRALLGRTLAAVDPASSLPHPLLSQTTATLIQLNPGSRHRPTIAPSPLRLPLHLSHALPQALLALGVPLGPLMPLRALGREDLLVGGLELGDEGWGCGRVTRCGSASRVERCVCSCLRAEVSGVGGCEGVSGRCEDASGR